MVKYTGRGLVVKRSGALSKVQLLNLVLGVGGRDFVQKIKEALFCRGQGSVNGGFQTVVRVLSGGHIPLPPFNLNLTPFLSQLNLFVTFLNLDGGNRALVIGF